VIKLPALKKRASRKASEQVAGSNPIERMEVLTAMKKSKSKEALIGMQQFF